MDCVLIVVDLRHALHMLNARDWLTTGHKLSIEREVADLELG